MQPMEKLLIQAMLDLPNGDILNIVQAANEVNAETLLEALSIGYYEVTNKDPGAETDEIGLR